MYHQPFATGLYCFIIIFVHEMKSVIRNARPSDAPFLAECILAGMHFADFDKKLDGDLSHLLEMVTECERREDTLYSYSRTRVAEVDGKPVAALLSYPGELYKDLKERTFRELWPGYFTRFGNDDPETDPGEYYLDSLAVHPDYRRLGIGRALLEDAIQIGLSQGYTRIALVADAEMPNLIGLYSSMGFVPADHRHAFGVDFLRMVYSAKAAL